ncbi:glyoxalase [Ferruginibacter lapsinanis]|uniref:VOC family protein n=1 Tax=Ferruginibacter lapsinanis TaxID=563172 RepID=UPI001E32A751|nr:VOC family protein [Ferruginibacter lapsinanis]UEG49987.1 glyoxalase [Ferruginibacter lapsinanis]
MEHTTKSIRPFIGSKDFKTSQNFYKDLGFQEIVLEPRLSYFKTGETGFYLQDAYVKDWIDNTMIFLEVEDVDQYWNRLIGLDLTAKYENVKIVPIRKYDWGKECFVHDPSGVLWHIGEFNK